MPLQLILVLAMTQFFLTLKMEQVVYLDAAESTRNGTVKQEMEHSLWKSLVFNGQATNMQKWKYYMFSKICPTFICIRWIFTGCAARQCQHTHLMTMEPLIAVGYLQI